MEEAIEAAWRKGLEEKGRDWVASELERLPGQPGDDVLDVVFQRPFPTREFCQRWCAEQDNRQFRISGNTIAVIVVAVICAVFTATAVYSLASYKPLNPVPTVRHTASE